MREGKTDHLVTTGFAHIGGVHNELPGDISVSEATQERFIFLAQYRIRMKL